MATNYATVIHGNELQLVVYQHAVNCSRFWSCTDSYLPLTVNQFSTVSNACCKTFVICCTNAVFPTPNANLVEYTFYTVVPLISQEQRVSVCNILDIVHRWCCTWQIQVNPGKTKVIHFRHKRKTLSNFIFHLGCKTIDYAHNYKYLGYFLSFWILMSPFKGYMIVLTVH